MSVVPSIDMLHWQSIFLLSVSFHHDAIAREDVSNYTFDLYKQDFGRTYQGREHEMRRSIFNKRVVEIQAHNAQKLSWNMGVNDLTDRTQEELKMLLGHRPWMRAVTSGNTKRSGALLNVSDYGNGLGDGRACSAHEQACASSEQPCCGDLICGALGRCEHVANMPESHDWSVILPTGTQVLNQGACGSCWAVAATGVLQLQAVINSGHRFRKQLSSQNLLSCTPNPYECGGQGGCQGATAELAYQWLMETGPGVLTVEQQAYRAFETKDACPPTRYRGVPPTGSLWFQSNSFLQRRSLSEKTFGPAISITGWKKLKDNSGEEMMKHLVTVGPLVGSVVGDGLYGYSSGIIPHCKSPVMDHAIIMMGYGKDDNHKMMYWRMRNSWGQGWGEKGFFRVKRSYPESTEPCRMDYETDKGVGCKSKPGPEGKYPESQEVCGTCAILGDTAYPIGTHVPEELL